MYMDSAKCVSAMIKTSKIFLRCQFPPLTADDRKLAGIPIKKLKYSDEKNYYGILRKCKQMVE
jgi:hypothetical protein